MQTPPAPVPTEPQATQAPSQPAPATDSPPETPPEIKSLDLEREPETPPSTVDPELRPHAFVIMPFGRKTGSDGTFFDFNEIYRLLIEPALELAGVKAFRADQETISGDILTDMFQELLLADLCIADMSIDNANVFYELGIRHAFRKRGVVHIQAGRAYMPFDVFNVRTIPYHITKEGIPDSKYLSVDRAAIARVVHDTLNSDLDAVHSPIFNLLDGLKEPDRRTLETPRATGFWRELNEWRQRVRVAERQKRIGDILLLTEEIRNPLIKEEAISEAALALKNMERYELALAQYRRGLELNPKNVVFRREEAFNLNRVEKSDEAIVRIEGLLADRPDDPETIAYLGRIYKEMWLDSWKGIPERERRLRTAFDAYHWLLKSFQTYLRGYRLNLDDCYPGINAHTLGTLLIYLADQFEDKTHSDPEIQEARDLLDDLRGALSFALETQTRRETADYWAFISLAELLVMTASIPQEVTRAYRKSLTAARRNEFQLRSSLEQLEILRSLEIRPEFVQAGMNVIKEELERMRPENTGGKRERKNGKGERTAEQKAVEGTGLVFLFAGHMVPTNRGQRQQSAWERESEIRAAINGVLDRYQAGPDDLAVTTGMDAGSELIFVECCVERGIPVQAYLPLLEGDYVRDFVNSAGDHWAPRFYRLRNDSLVNEHYQPECVGPLNEEDQEGIKVHERNNRWALYSALVRGIDKVRLIVLWDAKTEETQSLDTRLVEHMVRLVRDMGGIIEHINPAGPPHPIKTAAGPSGKSSKRSAARRKKQA